jgi:hypothetical protein
MHGRAEVLPDEGLLLCAVVGQVHTHQPQFVATPPDGHHQHAALLLRLHMLLLHCHPPTAAEVVAHQHCHTR